MSDPTTDTPQGWSFESIKESYLDADLSESWLRSAVAFLLAELRQVEERLEGWETREADGISRVERGTGDKTECIYEGRYSECEVVEIALMNLRKLAAGTKEPK